MAETRGAPLLLYPYQRNIYSRVAKSLADYVFLAFACKLYVWCNMCVNAVVLSRRILVCPQEVEFL